MPFFDPPPEPPSDLAKPHQPDWAPPLWDRPSEGTLPAVLPVGQLFARTGDAVLALDHVRAYPNGFELVVVALGNPRSATGFLGGPQTALLMRMQHRDGTDEEAVRKKDDEATDPAPPSDRTDHTVRPHASPFGGAWSQPRIGVRFSDGRRAGSGSPFAPDAPRDDAGIPTEPFTSRRGGSGSQNQHRVQQWVFPLPPPGPLEVHAEWSGVGIGEAMITISGDDVRDAATRAVVLWS